MNCGTLETPSSFSRKCNVLIVSLMVLAAILCNEHSVANVNLIAKMKYEAKVATSFNLTRVMNISALEYETKSATETMHQAFKILCTAPGQAMKWGSYIIRCGQFKRIAEQCAHVRVLLRSHQQIKRPETILEEGWGELQNLTFNATVSVKASLKPLPRFGRIFVDVVDLYKIRATNLHPGNEVLVQSKYHGMDVFSERKYHVVEHWYNSFLQDMLMTGPGDPPFTIPAIRNVSTLNMATFWDNHGRPCPIPSMHSGVVYKCFDRKFDVGKWYKKFFKWENSSELERLDKLLHDPSQGPGRIYYEMFWKFDALVVPAKLGKPEKLRYGNVQRAISQMRSGVPVLLEIKGEVFQDFLITHNYTCVFVLRSSVLPLEMTRHIWSFDEAIEEMKRPELRQKCQNEGLAIVKKYSPFEIVQKELRVLGYQDEFDCDRK